LPLDRLPHIQRDDQATIDHFRLKAALEQHLRRIGADPEKATPQQRAEAVDWFVREVAFTHLNRLVALKCLEVRGLIPEIITTRDAYGGRSRAHYDYRYAHPDEARQPDDALPAAIRHVCRQVYAEFKFLFDVGDPATGQPPPANSILWPSYPVLKECIALINGLDEAAGLTPDDAQQGWASTQEGRGVAGQPRWPSGADEAQQDWDSTREEEGVAGQPRWPSLWAEDEIIGWIYQFYNAEQKEAIRKRGKPRRPAEVAVINQFFTPRWIVKFLVDNTLGRLWLEMHPDSERVRKKCDYLVPEPLGADETGRQGDKETRGEGERGFRLDPDSPVNNPKAPPRREPKPVTEIRLIDPACGTMHFGHYAFEVFQEMYLDSLEHGWPIAADEEVDQIRNPKPVVSEVEPSEIPSLILRHNLYGVDIDLRAVQLAGLSLFIKAKTANPKAHISHLNLVVADAVLPTDGARQRFLDQYKDDKVVQDAVRQVLDEMANVAEVGSLLRVEERLRDILARAGHAAVRDESRNMQHAIHQLSLAEAPGAQPEEWGAHYTVQRLLDDLRAFAAEALQTHDLNAQLFAEEAEKSVHLLDVFLNDYDVVVMNPPYGDTTSKARKRINRDYPDAGGDLYTASMVRGLDMLNSDGYLGALTSRTYLTLATFEKFRQLLLSKFAPTAIFDLGFGVLDDALVETCLTVIRRTSHRGQESPISFFRKLTDEKFDAAKLRTDHTIILVSDLVRIPGYQYAYRAPQALLKAYVNTSTRIKDHTPAKMGLGTGRDAAFIRHHWEINLSKSEQFWVTYSKGGDFSRYYADTFLLVNWTDEGESMLKYPGCRLQGRDYFFKPGITWPWITVKGFNARILTSQKMFANISPLLPVGVPDLSVQDLCYRFDNAGVVEWFATLSYLNSELVSGFLDLITPSRNYTVGQVNELPALPEDLDLKPIARMGHTCFSIKASWDTGNEICTRFDAPWLVQIYESASQRIGESAGGIAKVLTLLGEDAPQITLPDPPTLQALLDAARAIEQAADARLQELQAQIDEAVYDLYEITPEDRALIERELGDRPPELVWPQMEGKSDQEKRREHVRRLISYFLLQALKDKRDGILPVTPGAGQTTALDEVRRRMETEFGEEAAFKMETEIKRVLGKSIADWLDGPFFRWHVKLYKKRPIIWHLASPRNLFGCFVYIHKMDRDTLRKVQTQYLWPRRRAAEAELEAAQRAKAAGERGAARRIDQAEAVLEDLAEFEKRLLAVIQGQVECDIPEWAEGPFRNGVYDPVLDDGVKVNITPLLEAGVLRYRKVV
jgi:hypothetical protein